ncbi:DUF3422 family protein [Prosthecodimorpha staleyi]|uniref:DUF3422 domain-containing protein n=1 Tax=Prosthecodimorpha staleyi TaxID=2840188 RepID=A0A947D234_9HYPH|nr:DUF3422 domain-containing protein [Prosthecodimorpha staleyi]MBT9289360.1 DUF3422 domain-containing protein [Prosthecodimorpha staleyi]
METEATSLPARDPDHRAPDFRAPEARSFEPHPLRAEILGEIHARPFRLVSAPRVFLHYAFEVVRGASKPDRIAFNELCRAQGQPGPGPDARHHVIPFGTGTLKWERHAEFTTYSWDGPLPEGAAPFAERPIAHPFGSGFVPPGPLLVAVRLDLLRLGGDVEAVAHLFDPASLCVSDCFGGSAVAVTDFRQDGDGRTRILAIDRGLNDQQAGGLAQRLLEIETYRTIALLGLPEAQRIGPDIRRIERELADIGHRIRSTDGLEANRLLLSDITRLTADLEAGAAESSYRFGASRAYDDIVKDRLGAIHEHHVPGYGTWSSFLARRTGPAMRTVRATLQRQEDLSEKLNRAAQLLRTRVDIELEQQNRDLLESMNRRARQQLRLQQTVEGLSVAAVSYYVVGLIGYLFKAMKEAGRLPVDPNMATGFAVPVVLLVVALIVRRIRAAHSDDDHAGH